ncbi:hypothetical protein N3K66_005016 [Trichothecium roseum]|uniref:Uncharacterized protein n=1 Tax=Trichothecium roseum TaxID=47278 RepID=A0ACC0V4D2_9HYPO|nr:hypothetical protein N3K66_005016 [Trichothecium roseum]
MIPHSDAPVPDDAYAGYSSAHYHQQSPRHNGHDGSHDRDYRGSTAGSYRRPLVPGIYVPTMCFFNSGDEDVDTPTIASHAVRLARAGVTGLATQGSNGEAVHLTQSERQLVTATTRRALDDAGYERMPLIVGCGSQSTRETVQLCRQAYESGGDYALVLPPSYYAGLFASKSKTILHFFTTVADNSPLPLIIYNFPGAVGGIDLSSDIIIELSEHPNIVGVKLTCGNTGKLSRVVTGTRRRTKNYNSSRPEFLVLGGSADFLIQSLSVGGHGILAGLANLAPKACLKTMEMYHQDKMSAAQALQETLSDADWVAIQGGVVGVKAGMQGWFGYGGFARSPLPRPSAEQAKKWKEGFHDLMDFESSL